MNRVPPVRLSAGLGRILKSRSDGFIQQVSPGKYTFMNANSRKFLDVNGGWSGDGAGIIQWPWTGSANQQWSFTPTGDGYYKFSPGTQPNGSLDIPKGSTVAGTNIQQWTWWGSAYQQWTIVPAN